MVEKISKKIAAFLAGRFQDDQDREAVYAYGLNILLGESLQTLVILLIASYLNVFYYTLVICSTFAAFRHFGGGPHLSTRLRCFLVSTTEIIALSLLATLHIQKTSLLILLICLVGFYFLIIYKWVPGGTRKKPLNDQLVRLQLKRKTLTITIVWFFISLYLLKENQTQFSLALILGALDAMLMITPIGYRFMSALDMPENNREGGESCESI